MPVWGTDGLVLGVMEIAGFSNPTERQDLLLNEVLPVIGLNLEIIKRNTFARSLLEESQRQANELQRSDEELRIQHNALIEQRAELLAQRGFEVTYVTSGGKVAEWSDLTAEQPRAHARLLELGVTVIVNTLVAGLKPGAAVLRCVFSGAERDIAADCFLPVTSRDGDDALFHALKGRGLASLSLIGDALAPGLIVHAVYAGHKLAREFGEDEVVVRRERPLA